MPNQIATITELFKTAKLNFNQYMLDDYETRHKLYRGSINLFWKSFNPKNDGNDWMYTNQYLIEIIADVCNSCGEIITLEQVGVLLYQRQKLRATRSAARFVQHRRSEKLQQQFNAWAMRWWKARGKPTYPAYPVGRKGKRIKGVMYGGTSDICYLAVRRYINDAGILQVKLSEF